MATLSRMRFALPWTNAFALFGEGRVKEVRWVEVVRVWIVLVEVGAQLLPGAVVPAGI